MYNLHLCTGSNSADKMLCHFWGKWQKLVDMFPFSPFVFKSGKMSCETLSRHVCFEF